MRKNGNMRFLGLSELILPILLGGFLAGSAFAQEPRGAITGTVVEESTGKVLSGAYVSLVGTQIGTLSRENGAFIIDRVPAGTHQIEFSFLGYATRRMQVTVAADQTATVNAVLSVDPLRLDELVATGYGSVRKEAV